MKKLLFILSLVVLSFVTKAQTGQAYSIPTVQGDTLNNADTVSKVVKATAGYSAIGIQVNLNKISGTVAGKAYLYQSQDGYNYALTDSASYTTAPWFGSKGAYSALVPTYTHVAYFQKQTSPSTYYLVKAVSSGTVSAAVKVLYTSRQYYITKP